MELQILGKKTGIPQKPEEAILETFSNKHRDANYLVPFIMPRDEFTAICPITGQPDTGSVEIIYVPRVKMIESKALKLYLASFRNHGEFHEDVTNRIANDLFKAMNPKYLRVCVNFAPRGGLAIRPLVERIGDDVLDGNQFKGIKRLVDMWDRKNAC